MRYFYSIQTIQYNSEMSDNNNITSTIRSYEDESTNPRRDIDQANLSGFRSDKTSQATLTEQKPSELVEQTSPVAMLPSKLVVKEARRSVSPP